jgi:hypothetical protein
MIMFKKFLMGLALGLGLFVGIGAGIAGTITATGLSQGDLVSFLSSTMTLGNEVKDDVDSLRGAFIAVLKSLDANGTITSSGIGNSTQASNSGDDWEEFFGASGSNGTYAIPAADVAAPDLSMTQ